jgi:hypothetical protein
MPSLTAPYMHVIIANLAIKVKYALLCVFQLQFSIVLLKSNNLAYKNAALLTENLGSFCSHLRTTMSFTSLHQGSRFMRLKLLIFIISMGTVQYHTYIVLIRSRSGTARPLNSYWCLKCTRNCGSTEVMLAHGWQ